MLSALAGDPECAFARAFAHRFPYIDDHALGNLVLTALAEETDSFSQAIRVCEELLRCVGHVHPSTLDPVTMSGVTVAGQQIHGQARISYGGNAMRRVWLDQQDPAANPQAVEAILAADLVNRWAGLAVHLDRAQSAGAGYRPRACGHSCRSRVRVP